MAQNPPVCISSSGNDTTCAGEGALPGAVPEGCSSMPTAMAAECLPVERSNLISVMVMIQSARVRHPLEAYSTGVRTKVFSHFSALLCMF